MVYAQTAVATVCWRASARLRIVTAFRARHVTAMEKYLVTNHQESWNKLPAGAVAILTAQRQLVVPLRHVRTAGAQTSYSSILTVPNIYFLLKQLEFVKFIQLTLAEPKNLTQSFRSQNNIVSLCLKLNSSLKYSSLRSFYVHLTCTGFVFFLNFFFFWRRMILLDRWYSSSLVKVTANFSRNSL